MHNGHISYCKDDLDGLPGSKIKGSFHLFKKMSIRMNFEGATDGLVRPHGLVRAVAIFSISTYPSMLTESPVALGSRF